jgi:chemotaxis protein MotB
LAKHNKHHHEEHPPHEEHSEDWLISYADLMTLLVGFFVILLSFSQVDEEKFEEAKKSLTKEFGGRYEEPYKEITEKIQKAIDASGLSSKVEVKRDASGVEIAFLGTTFFNTGSVDVKVEAQKLFDMIIPQIKDESDEFKVVIEGHTDDVPLTSGGAIRNNWELSSIRACRVLEFFLEKGFKQDKMTALGYGESRPLVPNRDEQGNALPLNQAQNRRVVIKLFKGEGQTL